MKAFALPLHCQLITNNKKAYRTAMNYRQLSPGQARKNLPDIF